MKVSFETKKESDQRQLEQFLLLNPYQKLLSFIFLSNSLSKKSSRSI